MALAQRTGRSRHRLVLLALTAITLLTVDLNGFGPAESAQRAVRDVLNPVASLASTIFSPVGDAWNSVFNYDDLEKENEELQAQIEDLQGAALRGEADTETLRRLLAASDIPYVADLQSVSAQVVRGSVGNFDAHVVTIDKGSRHGIEEGMPVVTGAGMVGRVDQVDNSTSRVQLLSDDDLNVGVRLVSTDQVGLGYAIAGERGMFVIDQGVNWPDTDDATLLPGIGTLVVTAGESGSYPADIPLGLIAEVGRAADEVSMRVEVELANDVGDLHFVSVVLSSVSDEFPLGEVIADTTGQGIDPDVLDGDEGDGG
jgi:rod shape-determining protein MreC